MASALVGVALALAFSVPLEALGLQPFDQESWSVQASSHGPEPLRAVVWVPVSVPRMEWVVEEQEPQGSSAGVGVLAAGVPPSARRERPWLPDADGSCETRWGTTASR